MGSPMYRQIAEDLREQIESGQLEPGQQLRTELELREVYNASRNTVRDAIKWLTNLGLVETKPGQGTFVVQKIDPFVTTLSGNPLTGLGSDEGSRLLSEVEKSKRTATTSPVQVEIQEASDEMSVALRINTGVEIISRHERRFIDGTPWSMQTSYYPTEFADRGAERLRSARNIAEGTVQKASARVADQLGMAEGSQIISRHQKRYIDGTPWSLQTSFYPMGFVVKGADRLIQADDIAIGTMRYLEQTLGLRQTRYRDWITVRAADNTEITFFNLPQDGRTGVFEVFRTAFDQTETPMRLTVTVYPTDRNQFIVNVGDVPEPGEGDPLSQVHQSLIMP